MTTPRLASGGVVLAAAAAIAAADIAVLPGVLQRVLPSLLGAHAGNVALVETVFATAVFGILIVAALIAGALVGRNVAAAGPRPGPMAAIGLAVGIGGVSIATGYAAIAGTLTTGAGAGTGAGLLLLGAGAVAVQVVGEEVFFRGWLQPALVDRWSPAAGVVATALLFAGLHVVGGARAPLSIANLFLGGLMFGLFALRGRGLAGAVGVHFGWNATEQLVWGLDPNPGVGGFGAIADRDLAGAALWGGSGEGLNASIGMTAVLLAILAALALSRWRSPRD